MVERGFLCFVYQRRLSDWVEQRFQRPQKRLQLKTVGRAFYRNYQPKQLN